MVNLEEEFAQIIKELDLDKKRSNILKSRKNTFIDDSLLDLSELDLNILPESLFNNRQYILHLNISNNNFKTLAEKIFNPLVDLISIDMSYCLPPGNLDVDELHTLPEYLLKNQVSLILLDISGNQLEFLPEAFFDKLYNIEAMNLSDNLLSLLPTSIGNCINLEELYLEGTNLPIEFEEIYSDYMAVQDFLSPFSQAWQAMQDPHDMINAIGISYDIQDENKLLLSEQFHDMFDQEE